MEDALLPRTVVFTDLGRWDYLSAWNLQTELHRQLIEQKRPKNAATLDSPLLHQLLFVEHPPTYTLGKSGKEAHLLMTPEELEGAGISFYKINRGGDITYHGPGQLVVYPIFDLDSFFHDVRRYVSNLEEAVIRTLAVYGVDATRYEGYTGVWLPPRAGKPWRKICAIGVHLSRWVTLHGLAFNVNNSLEAFGGIVPCGISASSHGVTSLAGEIGTQVDMQELKDILRRQLAACFEFSFEPASLPQTQTS